MRIKKFDLTGKCSLQCEPCFNQDFMKDLKEISIESVLSNTNPNDIVYLSGGEPMAYSKLEELTKELLKLPSEIVISTNGINYRKLPKEIQMQVSIWTLNEDLYSEITKGNKNNLEKIKKNIGKFISDSHPVFLNMPVYKKNSEEIQNVSDYADKIKVPLRINPIYPSNGFSVNETMLRKIEDDIFRLQLSGRKIIYSGSKQKIKKYFKK